MKRRLFNLAAAVSLVLCIATIALCGRARWRWIAEGPVLYKASADDGMQVNHRVYNTPFGIEWARSRYCSAPRTPRRWEWVAAPFDAGSFDPNQTFLSRGGHGVAGVWWAAQRRPGSVYHVVFARHWSLALLTLIRPAVIDELPADRPIGERKRGNGNGDIRYPEDR